MLTPFSNNQESYSYKLYKNNSNKLAKKQQKKTVGGDSDNCKIWNETTIARLKEVDFTCFVDSDTNKLFNTLINFIYDNILDYRKLIDNPEIPGNKQRLSNYNKMISAINDSAKNLSNSVCTNNALDDDDAVKGLSSIMCNYLFIEHVKDLYFIPKYISNIHDNYKQIELYSQICLFIESFAIIAGIIYIFMISI